MLRQTERFTNLSIAMSRSSKGKGSGRKMCGRTQEWRLCIQPIVSAALVGMLLPLSPISAEQATTPDLMQFQEINSAESELQIGTRLTRAGHFQEAIPHLLAARSGTSSPYAAEFNLALCYVATRQSTQAIPILIELRGTHEDAQVENLLAQAYVGVGNSKAALDAVKRASALTPRDEKLYGFVADACTENQNYDLGLDVVDLGLQYLPNSARLHYQRAMFLSSLDEFDAAKPDFAVARKLGAGSDIAFLAAAQENLLAGKVEEAVRAAREGLRAGHDD